jgi:DNA-binding response OmpR family regulator
MESILIIDDDVELCRMLDDYLTPHDFRLSLKHHAADGMDAVRRGGFDLIILDVMLPGLDGFAVLRAIRQWSDIGVLLLTARHEDSDRILGFESGADDYLPKPFNPRELLARIRVILRRGNRYAPLPGEAPIPARRLAVDGVVIDFGSRTAYCRDRKLDLTGIEFELLAAFLEAPGQVLPRADLIERVFERPYHPEDRSLDMCICRLRRKLDGNDPTNSRIRTIRSTGYLFGMKDRFTGTDGPAVDGHKQRQEG